MLVENQLVEMKWSNFAKKYYQNKGYAFTHNGDTFYVKPEDLSPTCTKKVKVICDGCEKLLHITYGNYNSAISKNTDGNYYCHSCAHRMVNQRIHKENSIKYYPIFSKWCEDNSYVPISSQRDCKSVNSRLYFNCPKHGRYNIVFDKILQGQKIGGCCKGDYLRKKNSTTSNKVKKEIEAKNNNILLNPDEYINTKTKNLRVICGSCGKEFMTSRSSILNSDGRCFLCGRDVHNWKSMNSIMQHRYDKYIARCIELKYKPIMDVNDFANWGAKRIVRFVCPKHGNVEQLYDNFVSSNSICKYCADKQRGDKLKYDTQTLMDIIGEKNRNVLLNPEEYISSNDRNLKIKCGSCGNVFIQSLNNYKRINLTGKCPDCNEISYGEYLISSYLDKYDVNYNRWFSFYDCRDKQPLPFDFYLPDFNLAIEFDGLHHMKPVYGEESFKTTKLHDAMKDNYCRWNNINLLRIPYWEGSNIEQILINYLHLTPQSKNKPIKIKYIPNRKSA